MGTPAQNRAVRNYRAGLAERGLARFEVVARDADRELIRALARRLAEDGPEAAKIREAVGSRGEGYVPKKGGVIEALRRSPLVGSGVEFKRSKDFLARSNFDALSARHQHRQRCDQTGAVADSPGVDAGAGRQRPVHFRSIDC